MKEEIYLPYAMWLAEQNRFIEAQKAFYKSGHLEKSFQVLNRLLSNSIIENRFNDASYYSWLLANHHDQTVLQNILNTGDRSSDLANSERLNENAELYFVYQNIFKYIVNELYSDSSSRNNILFFYPGRAVYFYLC